MYSMIKWCEGSGLIIMWFVTSRPCPLVKPFAHCMCVSACVCLHVCLSVRVYMCVCVSICMCYRIKLQNMLFFYGMVCGMFYHCKSDTLDFFNELHENNTVACESPWDTCNKHIQPPCTCSLFKQCLVCFLVTYGSHHWLDSFLYQEYKALAKEVLCACSC